MIRLKARTRSRHPIRENMILPYAPQGYPRFRSTAAKAIDCLVLIIIIYAIFQALRWVLA